MLTNPEQITRIAENEHELRSIFARSTFAPIADALQFAQHFPRSPALVIVEESRSGKGLPIMACMAGILSGAAIVSLWQLSPYPFVYALLAAIPVLMLARRLMASIYGATSQAQRFVELVCLDRRAPIVYLRRFEGEDPVLPTRTSRNTVVGRATNPAGTDTLENLAQLFELAGPVLGLGRPTDQGIEHRIHRLYTPHERWQEVVLFFLREAKAVLMSYEPGPVLDWELDQALKAKHAVLFVVIRNLPRTTVQDEQAALAALPIAITTLDRPTTFADKVSDKHHADEHGLLVVIAPDAVRVYGVKMHFQQLWDLLLEEIVHKLKITETRTFGAVPAAYRPLVQAVEGHSPWWSVLAFAAGAAAIGGIVAIGY